MKDLPDGISGHLEILVEPKHTAHVLGNEGMLVLGTPYAVWMVEAAAYGAVRAYLEPGEGIAGAHIDLYHRAPTATERRVTTTVRLLVRQGRRLTWAAELRSGDAVVADGTYESVIIDQAAILARAEAQPSDQP